MLKYLCIHFIITYAWSVSALVPVDGDEVLSPQIDGIEERIFNKSSNFELTCYGIRPIEWIYPKVSSSSSHLVMISETLPNGKHYHSSLEVNNATYLNTGWYACRYKTDANAEVLPIEKIYVYVEDEENLIVSESEENYLMAYESRRAVIPCKPTSPETNIMLVFKGVEITNETGWVSDPREGYILENATSTDAGKYECGAWTKTNQSQTVFYNLTINHGNPSTIEKADQSLTYTIYERTSLVLKCDYSASPSPTTEWLKDNQVISEGINSQNGNTRLEIMNASLTDSGKYSCRITNTFGTAQKYFDVEVRETPIETWLIIVITSVICLSAATLIGLICFYLKKIKKMKSIDVKKNETISLKPKARIPESFARGNPTMINPDIPIDQQIELLPYDNKWEFPMNKLTLGQRLGAGVYGQVLKGTAIGIVDGEEVTTVAVKKMRSEIDTITRIGLKALLDELKIMVNMGPHLNVVNMLGACFLDVEIDEISIILEYCPYGNLNEILVNNRENFINEIDDNGDISPQIDAELFIKSIRNYKPQFRKFEPTNEELLSVVTDGCFTSMLVDLGVTESPQTTKSNFENERKRPLCTRDLLCWAYQIANGMKFVASRKILHGDLATRNVLLSGNNIVKVADFGLARDIYKYGIYSREPESDLLLPVKWMAIESLGDREFSIQSDVWSFGVVLWELFSLGTSPYPGIQSKDIFSSLQSGYRMAKARYATQQLDTMMRQCWSERPDDRPTFTLLADQLGFQLDPSLRAHYEHLDDQYTKLNNSLKTTDYLSNMCPVTYVNVDCRTIDPRTSRHYDYLLISPSQEDDRSLLIDASKRSKDSSKRISLFNSRPSRARSTSNTKKLMLPARSKRH